MPPPDRRPSSAPPGYVERRASDTARSYAALCDYIAMGDGRSLPKLAERYRISTDSVPTKHVQTLKRWSMENDWQNRVQAADDAQRAADEAARGAIRAERRIALENADWEQGNALRDATRAILSELPKFIRQNVSRVERVDPLTNDKTITEVITLALKAGPGELAKAMEIASKIQRLSVGQPTEIHEIVERELGAMLDLLQSQLEPADYARVVAIIAGGAAAGG